MGKQYEKLVRDRIPEIIKSQGRTAVIRTLTEEDCKAQLKRKLLEEVNEYLEHPCLEELCDILEVIEALLQAFHFTAAEVEAMKSAKAERNGTFEKRVFLQEVIDS